MTFKSFLQHIRRKRSLRWGVNILLFLSAFTMLQVYNKKDVITGTLPEFRTELTDGTKFNSAERKPAPYILHFWASWCPVCRLEEHSINALAEDGKVISIAMQSGQAAEITEYMQKQGLDFPVIADPQGNLAHRFGVKGVPTSLVINSKNEIEYVEVGYTSEIGLKLRLWLAD